MAMSAIGYLLAQRGLKVLVIDFDLEAPGRLHPAPFGIPGRVIANLQNYQLLDSLAVEADGRVCVATIVNGGISVIEPNASTIVIVPTSKSQLTSGM
jgi:sugar lactone lactonase YvrE